MPRSEGSIPGEVAGPFPGELAGLLESLGRVARGWSVVLVVALALGSRARADDTVSVGVGIDPARAGSGAGDFLIAGRNAAPLDFHVQVALLPRLRLEASAAYFRVARNAAQTPPGGSSYDFSATAVGLGAVYYVALPTPFGFYAGGRMTIALYSGRFTDEQPEAKKVTMFDAFFAPVAGGEVALSRRLFLGSELQLPLPLGGDQSRRTASGANTPNIAGARLAPTSIVFLRYLVF